MRQLAPTRRFAPLVVGIAVIAAACGGGEGNPAIASGNGGNRLDLTARDVKFSLTRLSARAGEVTIDFDNQDRAVRHNLHLSGKGINEKTSVEKGPITQHLTVTLRPGTYRYVCDVHPAQMRGELTVTE